MEPAQQSFKKQFEWRHKHKVHNGAKIWVLMGPAQCTMHYRLAHHVLFIVLDSEHMQLII